MNRLEKTLKISEENVPVVESLKTNTFGGYFWRWCGDAATSCDKMVTESDGKIEMKIVLRDENEELMNLF
jgi:hypothetical protein